MVEDPGTSRNNMHENRETCSASVDQADRSAKAPSRKADAYALQESDRCVVPMKLPNTEEQSSTEVVEGRRRPKENVVKGSQYGNCTSSA